VSCSPHHPNEVRKKCQISNIMKPPKSTPQTKQSRELSEFYAINKSAV